MKYRWDKKYLYWGITAFVVIVLSVLFFFALFRIEMIGSGVGMLLNILKPILYGAVIAYLLAPAVNFFDRHIGHLLQRKAKRLSPEHGRKVARIAAVFVTILLAIAAVAALIGMIIPQLVSSIMGFVDSLPGYLDNAQVELEQLLADNPQYAKWAEKAVDNLFGNIDQIYAKVRDFLPSINNILAGVTIGIMGVLNVAKNVLVGIIVSIYLLYSKETFAAQAKKILYAALEPKRANAFLQTARETHRVFSGFIVGKLLDSLIIGILCFIFMNLFGWPLPLLISVIIGVTNVIPFFGPFIGAIPSALIILLVDPKACLYFVLFILILQQFDGNILGPKILGESTGLTSFWVIFAIMVGGGLFGFVGMIVGVPAFAVIYALIRTLTNRSLSEKGFSTDTHDYKSLERVDEKTGEMITFPPEK